MAIQVKRSGVWTTPSSGSISIKSGGVWKAVNSLSVKSPSGVWVNSGYVAYPSAPTNLRSTASGNGDNRTVTFAWNAGSGGAPVTGYKLVIYNSSNGSTNTSGAIATVNLGASTLSHTYTFASAGTTYYARIFAVGTAGETMGANAVGGQRLSIIVGNAGFYTDNYVWSTETYGLTPTFLSQTSGQDGPNAFDGNFGTLAMRSVVGMA